MRWIIIHIVYNVDLKWLVIINFISFIIWILIQLYKLSKNEFLQMNWIIH